MNKRIYVMDCGDFIKIGVSNNPNRRKEQIPYCVKQYYCTELTENAFEIERKMHSTFRSKRNLETHGREYFNVPFDEAVEALVDMISGRTVETKDVLKLKLANGNKKEMEQIIVEKLKEAIPKMSDFDKGYILGKTESLAADSHTKDKEDKED